MHIDRNDVIFSSGRVKYANFGIIGISQGLEITEGYDGGFHCARDEFESDEDYECREGLTRDEQIELADFMIETWQRFKDSAS